MYSLAMKTKRDDSLQPGMGYWVGSLASAMRKGLNHELAPHGVSAAQWAILETCFRGEANTPSGLSRVIPIDTAAISRHLDKLRAKGLIRRRRQSSDRRSVRVELTEAGRALVPELEPFVQAHIARFQAGITEEEQAAFIGIIQKILRTADVGDDTGEDENH